jgi:RNA polymerase sigma-70 factor, ECF subfamily
MRKLMIVNRTLIIRHQILPEIDIAPSILIEWPQNRGLTAGKDTMLAASPSECSDETLVYDARAGSCDSFAVLLGRHYGAVFAIGYAWLGNADMAEDLAQEVFLRAFLHLDRLKNASNFGAWVARIARNLAHDWQTNQAREASRLVPIIAGEKDVTMDIADERGANARQQIDESRKAEALRGAMAELERDDREIVVLHFARQWSHRQIAEYLRVPRRTVSYRLTRSLRKLRHLLGADASEHIDQTLEVIPHRVARAMAIIVAASGLSAATREVLAERSAELVVKSAMSSGGVPASSFVLFSKTITAAIFAGGIAVVNKSTVVVVGAVVAALIGGGYYHLSKPGPGRSRSKANLEPIVIKATPVPAEGGYIQLAADKGEVQFKGYKISDALERLLGFSSIRTIVGSGCPEGFFDIEAEHSSLRNQDFIEAVRAGFEKRFDVMVRREERETEVIVLKAPGGNPPAGLRAATRGSMANANSGGVVVAGGSPALLAMTLERVTAKPVIQEPILPGKFDYAVSWQKSNPDAAVQAVRQLGYEVVLETRKVEFLRIEGSK